jgi:endogenous inhibitor of DNA gyrase (YacG/DUF329 family)
MNGLSGVAIKKDARLKSHPNMKKCKCCDREFKPKKSWQGFCSKRCRLISWAAHYFVKAYLAGKTNALRPLVEKLREAR